MNGGAATPLVGRPTGPAGRTLLLTALLTIPVACGPADREGTVCGPGAPFSSDGTIELLTPERPGDTQTLRALEHSVAEDGCERVILALAPPAGASATAGGLDARILRELGVIRVTLPGVREVAPESTDQTFDGALARAAYVVRSPDGPWMYADVHLAAAIEARIREHHESGDVVIELRPGEGTIPPPPDPHRRVVVLSPRPGAATYPLTVSGYARTFEANVVARLEQEGRPPDETFTTVTGYVDAWGHYELTFPQGPSGPVTLHVGEYSARDGTWDGVAVALTMR